MSPPRKKTVVLIAPVAPPCFESRGQWVEYLGAAAEAWHDEGSIGPLIRKKGEPDTFNFSFNYCADCSPEHAAAMARRDLCKPLHLRVLGLNQKKVIPIVPAAVVAPAKQLEAA